MATPTLSPALQKLTTVLSQQGLTGTEIAEVMWFAATIARSEIIDIPARPVDPPPPETPETPDDDPQRSVTDPAIEAEDDDTSPFLPPPDTDPPAADLVPEPVNTLELVPEPVNTLELVPEPVNTLELVPEPVNTLVLPENYRPIPVPDASGIADPLEIARSLRVLAKKADVGQPRILDEAATVDRVAEMGIWQPVLRPAQELWWDVALVFDQHPSMCLWQRFAADLHRVLCRYGQFRDVRIWFLEPQGEGVRFVSRNRTVCHKPSELLTGDRRRLVVILSDCVGAGWHNGQMRALVGVWAKTLPTVVFQVFPERLWSRTALARSITVEFQAKTADTPNSTLKPTVLSVWDQPRLDAAQGQADVPDVPYMPVVPLDPQALGRWAGVLSGDRRQRTLGIVWDASPATLAPAPSSAQRPSVGDRLDTFILRASPLSRELATLLTAAPVITLPIVRLIRRAMLPQARTVHFAEVFMSGLLKVSGRDTPNFENAERIAYELVDEAVRERLRSGSFLETQDVLNRVSLYVAQGLGKSVQEFRALLKTPSNGQDSSETEFFQAFATVTGKILRGLGSDFETIADRLTAQTPAGVATDADSSLTFEPLEVIWGVWENDALPLETTDYTVAQLVEEPLPTDRLPAPLPGTQPTQFNYTVVTLNPDGSDRERYGASTTGFIETLIHENNPEQLAELEMIAIPGGEFLMGAPRTEARSYGDEYSQHRVSVSSFYLGRYPITQAQWRIVARWDQVTQNLDPDPSRFKGANHPVEQVSWKDAVEFCARLRQRFQRDYGLSSEAQWEYACRAGTITPFHFGDTLNTDVANYNGATYSLGQRGQFRQQTTPVGSLRGANAWGLLDMHGNVWEWCQDDWHRNYQGAPEDGSAWLDKNNRTTKKVIKGGSWDNAPRHCRSAYRYLSSRGLRYNNLGFRVACPAPRTLAL